VQGVRGEDLAAFFAAELGRTRKLALTVASAQTPDTEGALPPGRYLLQIADLSSASAKVFIRARPFVAGDTVTAVADAPDFPLHLAGLVAIEFHVRKGYNDRIAAILTAGTGNLFITEVSRRA
jgi:hypothetical protein